MIIEYQAISDVGCVRENNEDMVLIGREFVRDQSTAGKVYIDGNERFAAIVADGMGGNDGGELASDIAAQEFDTWLAELPEELSEDSIKRMANDFAVNTHDLINNRGNALEGFHGMGSTITGLFNYEGTWYWINVGDSRVYVYRDSYLRQVTRDHSMRNMLNDQSQPSNLIYNALGGGEDFDVFADCDSIPIFDGDTLIVCSDGLCDMVTDDQINELAASNAPAEAYIDAAKANGGLDNISVILVKPYE